MSKKSNKPRKTVKIADLVKQINDYNVKSVDSLRNERLARNDFIESILFDANAYNGYLFLYPSELGNMAKTPGIREMNKDGIHVFENTDSSRRKFFIKK